MGRAEGLHQLLAFAAMRCLQGPRLVVDPRMEHTRIVAGLMCCNAGLFLHDPNRCLRPALHQFISGRQANDTAADDQKVGHAVGGDFGLR